MNRYPDDIDHPDGYTTRPGCTPHSRGARGRRGAGALTFLAAIATVAAWTGSEVAARIPSALSALTTP